jgi:hypothetical protein
MVYQTKLEDDTLDQKYNHNEKELYQYAYCSICGSGSVMCQILNFLGRKLPKKNVKKYNILRWSNPSLIDYGAYVST